MGMTAPMARADIAESQTLLLWNSQDPEEESQQIKEKYLQLHPGVLELDLNVGYTFDHVGEFDPLVDSYHLTDIQPAGCGITRRYITPCKFRELFLEEGSAFRNFLAANPNILCIATTRGLPAAISDTITPTIASNPQQPGGGIYASFEATLSRLRYGPLGVGADSVAFDEILNPLNSSFGLDTDGEPLAETFSAYPFDSLVCGDLDDPDDILPPSEPLCPGEIFAVSRLDSAQATIDFNLDGIIDHVDGVLWMLTRSQNLTVNKYAVSAIFDTTPDTTAYTVDSINPAAIALWNGRWCYLIEPTDAEFIHGPADPAFTPCPSTDCTFSNAYPTIALYSSGKHTGIPDDVLPTYISYYLPHPAGIFLSFESYNGWFLHAGDGADMFPNPNIPYEDNHGQILDWIRAGGSFTIAHVQEPYSANHPEARIVFKAFLVSGYQWGEAALASLPKLGQYQTPIGDPLAKILAKYDPDITGPQGEPDRKVDTYDQHLVNQQFGQSGSGLQADINVDGTVDQRDRTLVAQAFGRNCEEPPVGEIACGMGSTCGNLNSDLTIDEDDLAVFDAYVTSIGGYQPCPLMENWEAPCVYDFNHDCELDAMDRAVIEAHVPTCFDYDFNDDGFIGEFDFFLFIATYMNTPANYDPLLDADCNGVLDGDERGLIGVNFGLSPCE
jgi:hypothetical protein